MESVVRVLGGSILSIVVFYLGMFVANFLVSLMSLAVDGVGFFLAAMAEGSSFWDFVVTVLEAGWIYFLAAFMVFKITLTTCDNMFQKFLVIVISCLFIINQYDINWHWPFWGLTHWLSDTAGAELWRSIDIMNFDVNVSDMRYLVFDIAVPAGALFCWIMKADSEG